MKLEPTEVQRKAMAVELKAFGGWTLETCHKAIDALIAAANSIPEGMPVGTIARRPDGEWIAWRTEDGWGYRFIGDEEPNEWPPGSSIADFWPVIYDPTKPEQKTYPYAEGDTIVIGPECFQVPSKGAIAWKGVWYFDPDYQLNWFPPGEEPLVPRPDPTAQQEPGESLSRGLDDLAAGRVSRRDDYLEPQPEPKLCSGCCQCQAPKPPRTPRVVDRLGVDEQGSLWRNRADTEFWFQDECWNFRTKDGCTSWYTAGYEPKMRIFTEILEPRVLPSLDCEEARDETVWRDRDGDRCQYRDELWWFVCDGPETWPIDLQGGRLTDYGPYVEVLS